MRKLLLVTASAMALGLPTWASAETKADTAARQPQTSAQGLQYRSAFADYKPWRDIKPADWRAVNKAVRDAAPTMGGHAHHGAQAPAAAASAPAAPAPSAQDHGSHHQHGGAK